MVANSAPKPARPSTTTVVTETQTRASTKTQAAKASIETSGSLTAADIAKRPKPTKEELKFTCNIYTKQNIKNHPTAGCMKNEDEGVEICNTYFSIRWSNQLREPCEAIKEAFMKIGEGTLAIVNDTCYPGHMMAQLASPYTRQWAKSIESAIGTAYKHATNVHCVAQDPKKWDEERTKYNSRYRTHM